MKSFISSVFLILLIAGCSDKYLSLQTQYNHKSKDGSPDYTDLNYWASHPWKKDPADSIPEPLLNQLRDTLVDVFFLHPTIYTSNKKFKDWNAAIDDHYNNAKTDYTSILYQASVFNQYARIFAPRYREAHFKTFFEKDSALQQQVFELAYGDIKTAFEYYLKFWNKSRPIIIAAHSQGSKHAERLLKEYFENKPLAGQLVVAYILGWPVPKQAFTGLKMCSDSADTGCLCSWRTFRKGYIPKILKDENGNSFVTNPLNWRTDDTYAGRNENKGAVLYKFNKVYKKTNDAQISNGLLWIKKPKFPWSFLYFTRNYHPGDINLFYINIRENAALRINNYLNNSR
jgi:hypothetical protein